VEEEKKIPNCPCEFILEVLRIRCENGLKVVGKSIIILKENKKKNKNEELELKWAQMSK